ncbi:MAG: prolipoprotein diacylglyceryl transferase [Caulobacteraceae bacterium]|nr:prolipoprotein diacylglyceryl transferase [Caulobacteraceae bacterium]
MALVFPDIRPEIFTLPAVRLGGATLGPFAIRWYALAYIAGILLGWRYAMGLARNPRLWAGRAPAASPAQIDDLVLWITLGVILGGRLGYVVFYMLPLAGQRAALAADPLEVLRLWHGGMSFHGGEIGVVLVLVGFALSRRIVLLGLADMVAACVPIGLFFGRVANFINGELWGRPTNLPWGMVFCGRALKTYGDGQCVAGYVPRHPSQLYEAALEGILLFVILRLATHRAGWLQKPGAVTGLFLVSYGFIRIALENVRMPDEGLQNLPFGLTVGIMLSAPMVLAGVWLIWRGLNRPLAAPDAHEPA